MYHLSFFCNWIVCKSGNYSDDCHFPSFNLKSFLMYSSIYRQSSLSILHTCINAHVYKNPKDKPHHHPDLIWLQLLHIAELSQMTIHVQLKCLDMNSFHFLHHNGKFPLEMVSNINLKKKKSQHWNIDWNLMLFGFLLTRVYIYYIIYNIRLPIKCKSRIIDTKILNSYKVRIFYTYIRRE